MVGLATWMRGRFIRLQLWLISASEEYPMEKNVPYYIHNVRRLHQLSAEDSRRLVLPRFWVSSFPPLWDQDLLFLYSDNNYWLFLLFKENKAYQHCRENYKVLVN